MTADACTCAEIAERAKAAGKLGYVMCPACLAKQVEPMPEMTADAIVRALAAKSPEMYEEWIERIKGPGKWCPLCDWVYPEKHYDMTTPMPHSDHCPYRLAVAYVAANPAQGGDE
jgi:hypothetical protein